MEHLNQFRHINQCLLISALSVAGTALASTDSIGPHGINSAGLLNRYETPLTGAGIGIGQVEQGRPGKSTDPPMDNAANSNTTTIPAGVFIRDAPAGMHNAIRQHAQQVAGVVISSDSTDPDMHGDAPMGVATGASLYSSAYETLGTDPGYQHALIAIQHVAKQADVRAVNHSWGKSRQAGAPLDANSLLTLGLDWSASEHDVLHVVAGNGPDLLPIPKDNFNGITIAASQKLGEVYRQVWSGNTYDQGFFGPPNLPRFTRTFTDLLAPGHAVKVTGLGNAHTFQSGTGFAVPHVTGTVALLQEYAKERIKDAGGSQWTSNARRHEVMKAILMNSADKIEDAGNGNLLGMQRTVVDTDGVSTWLDSNAFSNVETPLDLRMGAGHLNASRALQQFQNGEYNSDGEPVPLIGWDYGQTTGDEDIRRYALAQPLRAGSYISITLAWDRQVLFDNDGGTEGHYDIGDTFQESCCLTDLDLYLLPAGETDFEAYEAASLSAVMSVEHIFAPIAVEGMYEIWVRQFDSSFGRPQDYALAWWAVSAASPPLTGDFNGDGSVDTADYIVWRKTGGTPEQYDEWRASFGNTSGSGSTSSVPEPGSAIPFMFGAILARSCFERRQWHPRNCRRIRASNRSL